MRFLRRFFWIAVPALGASLWAGTVTPPFNECPAIGASPSCAIVYQFTPSGIVSFGDASVGPFDGVEDTLVGVINNSGGTVNSLTLSGVGTNGFPIFAFEGDGICTFAPFTGSSYCGTAAAPTTYEGPNTSFSGISSDLQTGTINFTGGLPDGGTAFFSLEDRLNAAAPPVASGGAPEPASFALFGGGLAILALRIRKRA